MEKEQDDNALLATLVEGDRRAAERLVERTYRQVYASLVRLSGNPELAADLTQETYRKAWKSLGRFRGEAQLATWLYRIAYNTYLNHLRRPRLVESLSDEVASTLPAPGDLPDEGALQGESASRLRRAVLALPETLRFTVSCLYWGELSALEVARLEGVTAVAIRKRLRKALAMLRLTLEEPA